MKNMINQLRFLFKPSTLFDQVCLPNIYITVFTPKQGTEGPSRQTQSSV